MTMFPNFVLAAGDSHQVTVLLLSLALLLGLARLLGEVFRKLGQPAIIGELLAGILLGATVLGAIDLSAYEWLFPQDKESAAYITLHGLITISATFLLLVAGLEVELSVAIRQGKAAVLVALIGMAIPFAAGFGVAMAAPGLLGMETTPEHHLAFGIFVGIAVSITALPVIAKILIDLNIFKADLGMLIMSAAIINDIVGWMGFAVVMALIAPAPVDGVAAEASGAGGGIATTLIYTVVFIALCLTVVRVLIHKALPYIQAYGSWPGAVIGFVLVITLLCAAATEWIGIHAIFGAFMAGVAIGDSRHLRQRTRETIHEFITSIFAPLFFASIGVYVNFVANFNFVAVAIVLVIAFTGKIGGCYLAAKIAGFRKRESMAVGFGMVAQGTMGVILGQLALDQGLIGEELFVAIVVVAFATSLAAGPGIQRALGQKQERGLADFVPEKNFVPMLSTLTARKAIGEMAKAAAVVTEMDADQIAEAVWLREKIMSTGIGGGIAVPHARLPEIDQPVVIIARSRRGVDFDASDGKPARIICMLLTPLYDQTMQIEMLRMVATTFQSPARVESAMAAENYTEFLAVIRLPGTALETHDEPQPTPETS